MVITNGCLLKCFRFGFYVDGYGPYGVTKISELKKEINENGEIVISPVAIESGIFLDRKSIIEIFSDIQSKFNIEIHDYEDKDKNRTIIWCLSDCELKSYSLSQHDAMKDSFLIEKLVIVPSDFYIKTEDSV